jgi:hypothetical protein
MKNNPKYEKKDIKEEDLFWKLSPTLQEDCPWEGITN